MGGFFPRLLEALGSHLDPRVGMLTGAIEALLLNPVLVARKILGFPAYTPRIVQSHNSNPIAELRNIEINRATLCALIRGQNRRSPVVLVLHGGPGASDIPFQSAYARALEEQFVVIHFDQRGACKSGYMNCKNNRFREGLTIEQHIDDTIKFSEWVIHDSGLEGASGGIYILGGSWGTMLAMHAAHRRPELFRSCILRGLCTDGPRSEELGMKFVINRMKRLGEDDKKIKEVASLGPPYTTNIDSLIKQREWLGAVGGSDYATLMKQQLLPRLMTSHAFSKALFLCPEISLKELVSMKSCMTTTLECMWPDVEKSNMIQEIKASIKIPVVVVHGIHDNCTSHQLVDEFMRQLNCPSKHVVWFCCSG
jgi:proline iminopeptidase